MSPTPEHNSYLTPETRGHTMFRRWENTPGSCAAVPREAARGPIIELPLRFPDPYPPTKYQLHPSKSSRVMLSADKSLQLNRRPHFHEIR